MKNKDLSKIPGLVIAIIASAYLGTSTLIAGIKYEAGLFVISLAFAGIFAFSVVDIVKELRK